MKKENFNMENSIEKICNKCRNLIPISEFYKSRNSCKKCIRIYIESRKDKIKENSAKYYSLNKERISKNSKIYHLNNKEKLKITQKRWKEKNLEHHLSVVRAYLHKNSTKIKEQRKKYRAKENFKLNANKWAREKRKNDLNYRLILALRNGACQVIKFGRKPKKTMELLGCSVKEFHEYIEKQFQTGMNWGNWGKGHGKWNIDHIKPVCSFDFSNPKSWDECFHHSNMQPMWWYENIAIKRRKTDYYKAHEEDNFEPLIDSFARNLNDSPD